MTTLLPALASNHVTPAEWLFVIVPAVLLAGILAALVARGRADGAPLYARVPLRFANGVESLTGIPGWSAAGMLIGLWALLVALLGFFWDVSWHIDLGRDKALFTPPHVMILMGLGGLGIAALASIAVATLERARVGLRVGPLHVPYGALALGFLGLGAVVGFPLDDFWHSVYGVDVTMWSPTHLLMIGGAVFSSFALAILGAEGLAHSTNPTKFGKHVAAYFVSTLLSALTAFQLEFDMGTPQFQQLYHPLLIALAAGIALTAGRMVFGRGGAIRLAVAFLVIRGLMGIMLASLDHVWAHFPIYIGCAIVVESVFALTQGWKPLNRALLLGVLLGTLGIASEWAWTQVFGRHPWTPGMLPSMWAPLLMAIAATVVGTAIGRALTRRRLGMPVAALVVSVAGILALMWVPLARESAPIRAHLATAVVGPSRVTVDNNGLPGIEQHVSVSVDIVPANAAHDADWFELLSWQGGAVRQVGLHETSPGHYVSNQPVAVGGPWKTMLRLARGATMVAVPVYMPADPQIQAPEVPLAAVRDTSFVRDTSVLMREGHAGPAWPATLAYGVVLGMAALCLGLLWLGLAQLSTIDPGGAAPRAPQRAGRKARSMPRSKASAQAA